MNNKKSMFTLLLCLSLFVGSGCSSKPDTVSVTSGNVTSTLALDLDDDGLWKKAAVNENLWLENTAVLDDCWTVKLWLKPDTNYPDTPLITIGDEKNYLIVTGSSRDSEFRGITINNGKKTVSAETAVSTNQWNYLSIGYKKPNIIVCLNGDQILQTELSVSLFSGIIRVGTDFEGVNSCGGWISSLEASNAEINVEQELAVYRHRLAAVLLDTVQFKDQNRLQRSLWLDSNFIGDYPLVWKVDSDRMDYRGIISDLSEEGDIRCVASVTTEESHAEKEFIFHVAGDGEKIRLEDDLTALNADITGVMHSGERLPLTERNGSTVEYTIEGNAVIEEGRLIKTGEDERESITIHAELNLNGEKLSASYSVVLLDEVYGYAMSYFNGELEHETGALAISTDGLNWTKVSDVSITANSGSGRVRDPSLSRSKDGSFLILATQGFDNPEIYLFTSEDLLTYSKEKMILVDVPDSGMGMSGSRAWAPVAVYDNERDVYVIAFSDPQDDHGAIYAVESSDLKTFTYPYVLFNPGYPVIDAVFFTDKGQYWIFYKDERKAAQTIFYGFGNMLTSGFSKVYDNRFINPQKGVEGPFVFKKGDEYYIYCDRYGSHTFLAGSFDVPKEDTEFRWFEESEYSLPDEDVRHGSVIPITEKEYNRLAAHID